MMGRNAWWLALDTNYVRYQDVKLRQVVAQGWPQLGDLSALAALGASDTARDPFEAGIRSLADGAYGTSSVERDRAPASLWRLVSIRKGDIVVAVEGTTVLGIAEMRVHAWQSYRYDAHAAYAQTVGYPVEWIDWSYARLGAPPTGPRRLLGVKAIRAARDRVFEAWTRLGAGSVFND